MASSNIKINKKAGGGGVVAGVDANPQCSGNVCVISLCGVNVINYMDSRPAMTDKFDCETDHSNLTRVEPKNYPCVRQDGDRASVWGTRGGYGTYYGFYPRSHGSVVRA